MSNAKTKISKYIEQANSITGAGTEVGINGKMTLKSIADSIVRIMDNDTLCDDLEQNVKDASRKFAGDLVIKYELDKIENNEWWRGRFHQFDAVGNALNAAWTLANNSKTSGKYGIIIFGDGGFGKSEGINAFCKHYNISPHFLEVGHQEYRGTQFLGGRDLMAISHPNPNERKFQFKLEDSFMAHETVVFEEGLDCGPAAIAILKDPIERKGYWQNNQFYESKLKLFIILTNTPPKDIGLLSASHKAVLERFPFTVKCEWDTFDDEDYLTVLSYNGLDDLNFSGNLAKHCALAHKHGNTISPRMIVKAATVGKLAGETKIKFVSGFHDYNPTVNSMGISAELEVANFTEIYKNIKNELTNAIKNPNEDDIQTATRAMMTCGNKGSATIRVMTILTGDSVEIKNHIAKMANDIEDLSARLLRCIHIELKK